MEVYSKPPLGEARFFAVPLMRSNYALRHLLEQTSTDPLRIARTMVAMSDWCHVGSQTAFWEMDHPVVLKGLPIDVDNTAQVSNNSLRVYSEISGHQSADTVGKHHAVYGE